MFESLDHPYRVPFDGSFSVGDAPTAPPVGAPDKKARRKRLERAIADLHQEQQVLYARDRRSVLLIFQAMDAAGKDGTIRAVLTGVNPAGCQVYSFKQPSKEELDHDFMWRTTRCLPERGRIGIFNRSYYEETLVVRVHPEYLENQRLPNRPDDLEELWEQRFESIRDHEKHLARNGTIILKFWLNVSSNEQRQRFLDRIDEPRKNWKFSESDLRERVHWDKYMHAYGEALKATSRPWAPWYAIPADSKSFMRLTVAEIIADTLRSLGLQYPDVEEETRLRFDELRKKLRTE